MLSDIQGSIFLSGEKKKKRTNISKSLGSSLQIASSPDREVELQPDREVDLPGSDSETVHENCRSNTQETEVDASGDKDDSHVVAISVPEDEVVEEFPESLEKKRLEEAIEDCDRKIKMFEEALTEEVIIKQFSSKHKFKYIWVCCSLFQPKSDDLSMNDKSFISKQIEAQVGLKQNLFTKYNVAKEKYEVAYKKRSDMKALAKVDAYKNWKKEEERKGRVYDEQCKNWVKKMMQAVKESEPDPVIEAMTHVVGNNDGKFFLHGQVCQFLVFNN